MISLWVNTAHTVSMVSRHADCSNGSAQYNSEQNSGKLESPEESFLSKQTIPSSSDWHSKYDDQRSIQIKQVSKRTTLRVPTSHALHNQNVPPTKICPHSCRNYSKSWYTCESWEKRAS